ncbi:MlaD family protein [Conexibacter sp. SYSU D00693]|uniref:MlaD family protein n=1 Tax=Conexibacter sp. SYSU D00693 TaxID=2812560 RepID=UPI00196B8386|nr:MlaD family protein [Conexibacter sp. SYSU D00693]
MRAPAVLGALLVGVAVLAGVLALGARGDDPYVVKARIADAEGIGKDYVVRVDGVEAGRVADVGVSRDDVAWVEVELDDEAGRIGPDARLSARAANLLGEKYLDLQPGDRRRPQPSGSWIPLSRTSSEVQLDDVFNTLDATTRMQLRILVNEAGLGLAQRGQDLGELLEQLPGTLRETRGVLRQVAGENAALGELIERGERVVTPSARKARDVSALVTALQRLLGTAAARRAQLAATVREAPGTLVQLRSSLRRLSATAQDLGPAARQLRRAAPELTDVLGGLPAFARTTGRTLDTAREVAPDLRRLGRDARPDVRRLTSTLGDVARFGEDARPTVESLGRGKVFSGVLHVMQNWTRAINQSDSLGHYFRLRVVASPTVVRGVISQLTPQPTKRRTTARRPARPARPSLPDAVRDLPEAPARLPEAVKQLPDAVKRLPEEVRKTVEQVQRGAQDGPVLPEVRRLLDFLLG